MRQKPASRIIWAMSAIILVCLTSISSADGSIRKSNGVICNNRQQYDSTQDSQCSENEMDSIATKNPSEKNLQLVKSTAKLNHNQNEQPLTQNSLQISTRKRFTEQEYSAAYKWSQLNQFKVYPSKLQSSIIPKDEIDVTLVTQLSLDRMTVFEAASERWAGPISCAVYVSEKSMDHFNKFLKESEIFSTRQNIGCQIVKAEGEFYPINYLRNVALQNSRTNFNFLVDVDFIPSTNLYENIRGKIGEYLKQPAKDGTNKTCFVIPAFKMKNENMRNNTKFPDTKNELLFELNAGRISKYGMNGHLPTKYKKWMTAHEPYFVNWAATYEPYIVIDKNAPKYDANFVGYTWDKSSHLMEVAANGYKFLVMHDSFIVHMPHLSTKDKITLRHYPNILDNPISNFLTDFVEKYGNASLGMVKQVLLHVSKEKYNILPDYKI